MSTIVITSTYEIHLVGAVLPALLITWAAYRQRAQAKRWMVYLWAVLTVFLLGWGLEETATGVMVTSFGLFLGFAFLVGSSRYVAHSLEPYLPVLALNFARTPLALKVAIWFFAELLADMVHALPISAGFIGSGFATVVGGKGLADGLIMTPVFLIVVALLDRLAAPPNVPRGAAFA